MLVFSSVTGHISPELYDLVPGADPSDKAIFISLLAKAPFPELAKASVQVTVTQSDDGVVVQGEWMHVAKIQELLAKWMKDCDRKNGLDERAGEIVADVSISRPTSSSLMTSRLSLSETAGDAVSVMNKSTGNVMHQVVIKSEEFTAEKATDNGESAEEIVADDRFFDKCSASDGSDLQVSETEEEAPLSTAAEDKIKLETQAAHVHNQLVSPVRRPRGRPPRKGRPRKSKTLPVRRARSRATVNNQAVLKQEAHSPGSEDDMERIAVPNTDYEDLQNTEGENDTLHSKETSAEVLDLQELQDKVTVNLEGGYQCTLCDHHAAAEKNILEHVARKHGERRFHCKLCTKSYALRRDLQAHMPVHHKKFQCDLCPKVFATRYQMLGHRRRRHENPRKTKLKRQEEETGIHPCKQCPYVGKKLKNLLEHVQRIHGERKFCCPICDKTYAVNKELTQHMKSHTEQFCCEHCGRVLKSRHALKLHTDIQHKGVARTPYIKNHLCNLCGLMFPNKTKYVIHQNKEHFNYRPFKCETCEMAFFAKAYLKDHLKVHEDRRDFSCEVCGKAFKMRQNLKMHMVTHSDNRPWKCEICCKTFTQNAALKRHARIHTGERPFRCHLCTSSFNDYSILTRHMQGVHGIDRYKFNKEKNWVPTSPEKPGLVDTGSCKGTELVRRASDPLFFCYICDKTFAQELELRRHNHLHHENLHSFGASNHDIASVDGVASRASESDATGTLQSTGRPLSQQSCNGAQTESIIAEHPTEVNTQIENEGGQGLQAPYLPAAASRIRGGLSESATKVATALNTLAQELAMRNSLSQPQEHFEALDQLTARPIAVGGESGVCSQLQPENIHMPKHSSDMVTSAPGTGAEVRDPPSVVLQGVGSSRGGTAARDWGTHSTVFPVSPPSALSHSQYPH